MSYHASTLLCLRCHDPESSLCLPTNRIIRQSRRPRRPLPMFHERYPSIPPLRCPLWFCRHPPPETTHDLSLNPAYSTTAATRPPGNQPNHYLGNSSGLKGHPHHMTLTDIRRTTAPTSPGFRLSTGICLQPAGVSMRAFQGVTLSFRTLRSQFTLPKWPYHGFSPWNMAHD